MITPSEYLKYCRIILITSPIVQQYRIIEAQASERKGYIRVRVTLINGDFLEMAEYFTLDDGEIVTRDYRFQWMNEDKTVLRYRWDSTPHFPELPEFPHHIHNGSDGNVMSHSLMNFEKALEEINILFEQER